MTPEEARHVTVSFGRVFPYSSKLATVFYEELFDLDPASRSLFPEDMAGQREKLADTLHLVVTNLTRLEKIMSAIEALGQRHATYGAEPAHYEVVGLALITALKRVTPAGLSPEEERAWITAYQAISSAMQNAAAAGQHARSA